MTSHYLFIDYVTQGYILVVGTLVFFFHDLSVPGWRLLIGAHVVLLFLVHQLVSASGRGRGGSVLDFLRHFYPVILYAAFYRESGMLSQMFVSGHLDPVIIRWEQALFGFQPSMQFMAALPWLPVSELFYASYFSYYVMIGGVGLALFFRRREAFFHYVSVLSFVFYVCYLIYIFLPVIGPRLFSRSLGGFTLPPDVQALVAPDLLAFPPQVTHGPFFRIMALDLRRLRGARRGPPEQPRGGVDLHGLVFLSLPVAHPLRAPRHGGPALPLDHLLPLPLCHRRPGRAGDRRRAACPWETVCSTAITSRRQPRGGDAAAIEEARVMARCRGSRHPTGCGR